MDKYAPILKKVLKQIKPIKEDFKVIDHFLEKINKSIVKSGIKAKAVIGGSYAKNTFLKGDHDVDIFVKFALEYDNLSDLLEKILARYKTKRVHGSRDYFQIKKGKITYELIPVLDIKKPEDAKNVTDFSPLHAKWVNKNVKGLRDDIRLIKKFCKSNNLYGAESYIKGFSGHVLDILTIYYGGFLEFLREARNWDKREVIDFYDHYKGKALFKMNISKIQCPLIVVDPVHAERNAASALGWEKYEKFKELAEEFLHHPDIKYFEKDEIKLAYLKKRHGYLLYIEVFNLEGKRDVVGSKLLKVYESIKKVLGEFYIHESDWEWDEKKKAKMWFNIDKKQLAKEMEIRGPPVKAKKDAEKFKKVHKNTYIKNNRLFAKEKREKRDALELVEALMDKQYMKEKIKRWKVKYYG